MYTNFLGEEWPYPEDGPPEPWFWMGLPASISAEAEDYMAETLKRLYRRQHRGQRPSPKRVIAYCYLSELDLIEYGVSITYPWLTPKGVEVYLALQGMSEEN